MNGLHSTSDAHRLRESIREAGRTLGFDQVGFAPSEPPKHARAYEDWLEKGYHGEMGYMSRPDSVRRRLDPGEALSGCRTVIVTSLLYGPAPAWDGQAEARPSELDDRSLPLVARYAVGRDYHEVFEERLGRFADAISELVPDARSKLYVDYGPVLERDHAQRAGLGWIGKNTMLIDPSLGSYLMLGELLTDVELPPDEPFEPDRCGSCRSCLDACPTDAITEDRAVDARRCISYLTIELKGPIPEAFRASIGNRVFGCDICQEVCPWNRAAPEPKDPPFAVNVGKPVPPQTLILWAEELLELDAESFRARYRGTAFSRPGRDGLLRNLAVGLGNVGGPSAMATLERLVAEGSDLVREHAQWALRHADARRPNGR